MSLMVDVRRCPKCGSPAWVRSGIIDKASRAWEYLLLQSSQVRVWSTGFGRHTKGWSVVKRESRAIFSELQLRLERVDFSPVAECTLLELCELDTHDAETRGGTNHTTKRCQIELWNESGCLSLLKRRLSSKGESP